MTRRSWSGLNRFTGFFVFVSVLAIGPSVSWAGGPSIVDFSGRSGVGTHRRQAARRCVATDQGIPPLEGVYGDPAATTYFAHNRQWIHVFMRGNFPSFHHFWNGSRWQWQGFGRSLTSFHDAIAYDDGGTVHIRVFARDACARL